jgi:hypothetical protein
MIEQQHFPAYLPDSATLLKKRVSLMLTYEQILMVASCFALLHSLILSRNPFVRLFFRPLMTDSELSAQTAIHNSCINAALSFEEFEKSKPQNEK